MTQRSPTAAVRFEHDDFWMGGSILGRKSAGYGFLRALAAASEVEPVIGYGPRARTAEVFDKMVKAIRPEATTRWIRADHLTDLADVGVCFRPDPELAGDARLRLRAGLSAYSLCGITHSLSEQQIYHALADLVREPFAPWDAIICTSSVAADVVTRVLDVELDYLSWRLGRPVSVMLPQTPVIPLGIHLGDFSHLQDQKPQARARLGLADDEVAVLYAGRLSFIDKAHPAPMYRALESAAQRSGKRIVLLLSGQWGTQHMEAAFRTSAAMMAPTVRLKVVDGGDTEAVRSGWSAADIFVSFADSIQETFGLTPVEAMAAGLPVVVSDWNGYKDTVRDGVDGFRIATWSLAGGFGGDVAREREAGVRSYGGYGWGASAYTSMDLAQAADRLTELVTQPELRLKMGQSGRARAQAFVWSEIIRQYQALWAELDARRATPTTAEQEWLQTAPPRSSAGIDPFELFGAYPTHSISAETRAQFTPDATVAKFREFAHHALFAESQGAFPAILKLGPHLARGPSTMADLAALGDLSLDETVHAVASLAKMGFARLS